MEYCAGGSCSDLVIYKINQLAESGSQLNAILDENGYCKRRVYCDHYQRTIKRLRLSS